MKRSKNFTSFLKIRTEQIQVNAAYEQNSIPDLPDENLPTTWWEIEGDKLKMKGTVLGSGQFGIILLGEVIKDHGQRIKCAVKTLKRKKSSILSINANVKI